MIGHYLLHGLTAVALIAAGRCRQTAPFLAYVAVAGAAAGALHHQHADAERRYHTR